MAVRDRLILVAYKNEKAAPGTRPPRNGSDRSPYPEKPVTQLDGKIVLYTVRRDLTNGFSMFRANLAVDIIE